MLTVYGIASCGTVKKARKWLDAQGAPHEWVDFRKNPVSSQRVAAWVGVLGSKAMRNTSGGAYRALPTDKADWDDARWADAFAANPMLIKRPIIERDGVAVQVGFRGTDQDITTRLMG